MKHNSFIAINTLIYIENTVIRAGKSTDSWGNAGLVRLQNRVQKSGGSRAGAGSALAVRMADLVPDRAVDDGVVLAGVAIGLVNRLADVSADVQHPVDEQIGIDS